jgi:phosphoribosyl-ATP pyrophosphohydrolase/phosphoribosyl-AMP cyclohydrolase
MRMGNSFAFVEWKFDENGLLPTIVQDSNTREVLTLAYMNRESLSRTLETGETWFWSRSRRELWHKGETSGNTQRVIEIKLDCDGDAIVVLVEPAGPACHTGQRSCFHHEVQSPTSKTQGQAEPTEDVFREGCADRPEENLSLLLDRLYSLIESRRRERPAGSYTTYLFDEGLEQILAKVREEAGETVAAGKSECDQRLVEETSDLLYHLLVLLAHRRVTLDQVRRELAQREGKSGLR